MIYQIIDLQCETFCCCFIIIFSYSRCKSSIQEFNDDLKEVNDRAFQWEMSFNADPSKQAQEVIFRIGCNIRFQLWTLEDHLNKVLVKANKTACLYANFEIYYQQLGHLPYTRLSLDSIWIVAMSCTIKLLTSRKIGIDSTQHMPSLSRINKGYVKRKNLSSTGIGVPLRSTLV